MNGESHLEEGKTHLSEFIEHDYDKEIAPYRLISIVSGVGSGKNTMIDHLVDGDLFCHQDGTKVEKQAVLLITSRRAKANEQLSNKKTFYGRRTYDDAFRIWYENEEHEQIYLSDLPRIRVGDPDTFDSFEVLKHSVAQTNAKVEMNLKWSYIPEDPLVRPWERFDMIVIDEVHALLADATYQSAPYFVRRLIQETLKNSDTCKVIVMTGTPKILERYPLFKEAHTLNLMNKCINVTPKRVTFISKKRAEAMQKDMLRKGERFVAFFNHIDPLIRLVKDYPEVAVASFSDEKRIKWFEKENKKAHERMEETQNYLAEHKRLPDNVIGFLSTARNKEGISIENEDIHVMFTESHVDVDIIQMAGRLRNPVDVLYVIVDSEAYACENELHEQLVSQNRQVRAGLDEELRRICAAEGYPLEVAEDVRRTPIYKNERIAAYIDYVHKRFPYIRFDYFTNSFAYYPEREIGRRYYQIQNEIFEEAKILAGDLIGLARSWFPSAECTVARDALSYVDKQQDVEQYLWENNWLDGKREIRQNERKLLLWMINWITAENGKKLASLLKKYGFELVLKTKSKKSDAPYVITQIKNNRINAA